MSATWVLTHSIPPKRKQLQSPSNLLQLVCSSQRNKKAGYRSTHWWFGLQEGKSTNRFLTLLARYKVSGMRSKFKTFFSSYRTSASFGCLSPSNNNSLPVLLGLDEPVGSSMDTSTESVEGPRWQKRWTGQQCLGLCWYSLLSISSLPHSSFELEGRLVLSLPFSVSVLLIFSIGCIQRKILGYK